MPYISTEQVKSVRLALKKKFPNVKFSITREHCTNLHVCILESNIDFTAIDRYNGQYYKATNISHFYIKESFAENEQARLFLTKVLTTILNAQPLKIVSEDGDYGSIPNYYLNLRIGKWDKPYILKQAA
jgi:hypothetical protein